jgi:biopolymer transport protein TolQ|tara:strand:+ start:1227 stop:1901 length:675 start_codon:yes stop_codon:yes gene_type:complete
MNDISVLNLFLEAGLVVKTVMMLLLLASLLTWIVIVERYNFYKKIKEINTSFHKRFWSGEDLNILYDEIAEENIPLYGSLSVFNSAFKEFKQLNPQEIITELDLEGINRCMRVAIAADEEEMNKHLPFLANVGSVSPYVGLLGTVWGIMTSFQGLSDATQATINAVAPGISEALVATAMGLFAAIPAVIAFNKYTSELETMSQSTLIFSEELASIFYKQSIRNK